MMLILRQATYECKVNQISRQAAYSTDKPNDPEPPRTVTEPVEMVSKAQSAKNQRSSMVEKVGCIRIIISGAEKTS